MLEMLENGGPLHGYVLTFINEPLPTQFPRLPEHKNLNFVLEKPENEGFEAQKSTKTSILCSKTLKTGARRPKKHKNLDFVLEKPENGGLEG